MFDTVQLRQVPLRGYAPQNYRPAPRRIGQLVSVNPQVTVAVNTGIEQYLFPVGLMLGGGASFLVGTAFPMGVRPYTTVVGLALVASGVGVLIYRGTKANPPAAAAPAAPAPTGGTPIATAPGQPPPASFTPAPVDAFSTIQVSLISPQPDQTIQSAGGFLGVGTKNIPVQVSLYNPSAVDVTFNLNFAWDEMASLVGYSYTPAHGTQSFQVTIPAGQVQNQTFNLPVQSSPGWSQMQADLQVYTQRSPQDNQQLLQNITFTVT
jgi:hypothetical protein